MPWLKWLIGPCLSVALNTAMGSDPPSILLLEENFPPFGYRDADGQAKGYTYEVLVELTKRLPWKTTVQFSPWSRAEREMSFNPQVLVASMLRTPDRETKYHWVIKLFEQPVLVYRVKTVKVDRPVRYIIDLRPYKIGTLIGSAAIPVLRDAGIPDSHIDIVNTASQNINKARIGRIDFFTMLPAALNHSIGSSTLAEAEFESALTLIESRPFYLAANLDLHAPHQHRMREVYAAMESDGTLKKLRLMYGLE